MGEDAFLDAFSAVPILGDMESTISFLHARMCFSLLS